MKIPSDSPVYAPAQVQAPPEAAKPAAPEMAPAPPAEEVAVDTAKSLKENQSADDVLGRITLEQTAASPYQPKDGPAGAYYRKVESARSPDSRSIEGTAKLPEPQFDTDSKRWRMEVENSPWKEGPCDRPSVYLGGNSGSREVDAGLTWDRVYNAKGDPTFTPDKNGWTRDQGDTFTRDKDGSYINASTGQPATEEQAAAMKPNCAFRPYVRTSNVQTEELAGLTDKQKEKKKGEDWHTPQRSEDQKGLPANVYFYPGDKVNMKFGTRQTTKDDPRNIELTISKDGDPNGYTGRYAQENWPGSDFSFKRVNSLDQVGGEAHKQVETTKTTLKGGGWENVTVTDKNGNSKPLTPGNAHEVRGSDTKAHYKDVFQFKEGSFDKKGSEYVDIDPSRNK